MSLSRKHGLTYFHSVTNPETSLLVIRRFTGTSGTPLQKYGSYGITIRLAYRKADRDVPYLAVFSLDQMELLRYLTIQNKFQKMSAVIMKEIRSWIKCLLPHTVFRIPAQRPLENSSQRSMAIPTIYPS